MGKFRYKAVRENGQEYGGEVEARDRFQVYDLVRKDGSTIVSVSETGSKFSFDFNKLLAVFHRVKVSERLMLTRNLAAMLGAGLPISRAIDIVARQTANPKLKSVLQGVNENIRKGKLLNEALAQYPSVFSPLMVAMVRAGEESGKLAEALLMIGRQLERSHTLRRKIRGAMMYPAIVILAMLIIAVLMLIMVVPTLTTTFAELGAELPISTRLIIGASAALTEYAYIALPLLLLAGVGVYMFLRSPRGKRAAHFTLLHFPLIQTLVKQSNAAQTARTLSSLLSSGVEVVHALSVTGAVIQNSYYKDVLKRAEGLVEKGLPISQAFAEETKIYPVLVGEMIAVGEETGELSKMLESIAEFFEGEVEQKTKDLSTIVEPILMIVIGAGVGFFAYSMILPIYSISESI